MPAEVNNQLNRLLSYSELAKSRVLSQFLTFVVHETLSGRENTIKEYTIGVYALNRDESFDPQKDAIVRVHGVRLRKILQDYYSGPGQNDPVRIQLPKGKYVPVFEEGQNIQPKEEEAETAMPDLEAGSPIVAVFPFRCTKEDDRIKVISNQLCEEIAAAFTQFSELRVISYPSAIGALNRTSGQEEAARHLYADFYLSGSCYLEGRALKILIALISSKNNEQVWADAFMLNDFLDETLIQFPGIVRKVVSATCGFFGIIYKKSLSGEAPVGYNYLYAVYWHNQYHRVFTEEIFNKALSAIELALAKYSDNALLLSLKAEFILNIRTMDIQVLDIDPLKTGTQLAWQAAALDPNLQHAQQVLAWACLQNQDKEGALKSIERLMHINPNNPMYTGSAGFAYICAGEYERGFLLMTEAIQWNPYYPWFLNAAFYFYYLHIGEYQEALYWANLINRKGMVWDPLLRLSALGLLARSGDELEEVRSELFSVSPDFRKRAKHIVGTFLQDNELKAVILEGLRLAGAAPAD